MKTPSLPDLACRIAEVRAAGLLQKAALVDEAMIGLLLYLTEREQFINKLDARIHELENNQAMKITYKGEEHGEG